MGGVEVGEGMSTYITHTTIYPIFFERIPRCEDFEVGIYYKIVLIWNIILFTFEERCCIMGGFGYPWLLSAEF